MKKESKDVNLGNRLKKAINYIVYLEELNSQKEVAAIIGKDKTNLSKAINGDTAYIRGYYEALCDKYSFFNKEWFTTGKGQMLLKDQVLQIEDVYDRENYLAVPQSPGVAYDSEEDYQQAIEKGLKLLPEVEFKFAAGQVTLITGTEDITRYWHLPDCKDCEGVAQVVGNSMIPALPSGCWIALKKHFFDPSRYNQIPFGNVFGIVVEDPFSGEYHGHIKILRKYKDPEMAKKYWIAHSINSSEFDDFDIEITQVRSLWIVKQHIVSDILL